MDNKKRKRAETAIRSYVTKHVMSRHDDVDEEDAVTLLTILVETGLVDPHKLSSIDRWKDHPEPFWYLYVDKSGPNWDKWELYKYDNDDDKRAVVPREVVTGATRNRRRRITSAYIGNWGKPWEFHTEKVYELLDKLECLENLHTDNCDSFRLTETLSRFPNLKLVDILDTEHDAWVDTSTDITIGPTALMEGIVSNVESIRLNNYTMESEDDLATFLFDVLPFFPKLFTFAIGLNRITSYQKIAQRIHDNDKPFASRLRILYLGKLMEDIIDTYNYRHLPDKVTKTYEDEDWAREPTRLNLNNPLEVQAMKKILWAFRELDDIDRAHYYLLGLGHPCDYPRGLEAEIYYLMEINHAGRVLVETKSSKTLPLSVWPIVFKRAWIRYSAAHWDEGKPINGGPDGIYYLLQNVQALQEVSKRNHDTKKNK
jgi:hypothetical protein